MARERIERRRRKHELHASQRASDIVRVGRHECGQRRWTIANFLADGSHRLAIAIANEQPHQRPRHKLGQRAYLDADRPDDDGFEHDERLGIFPVGAALLANDAHSGCRE